MIESSPAWVIHHYPIRDNLLLLYVLTPQRYFKAFYRLSKKEQRIKPQVFCPYWMAWKENRSAINIQSLECRAMPYWFKDLKLFVSLYLNELIFYLCRMESLESFHFYTYYEALLAHPEPCPELLLRQFEWQLLADCGYAIDFSRTVNQESVVADKYYIFQMGEGFIEAKQGYLGQLLLDCAQEQIYPENFLVLKKILRQTIQYVLDGQRLHSRDLLSQWLRQNA